MWNYFCFGFQEDVSQCGTASLPSGKLLASIATCVTVTAVWLLSGDLRWFFPAFHSQMWSLLPKLCRASKFHHRALRVYSVMQEKVDVFLTCHARNISVTETSPLAMWLTKATGHSEGCRSSMPHRANHVVLCPLWWVCGRTSDQLL